MLNLGTDYASTGAGFSIKSRVLRSHFISTQEKGVQDEKEPCLVSIYRNCFFNSEY